MTESEKIFNQMYFGICARWSIIYEYRNLTKKSYSSHLTKTSIEMKQFANEFVYSEEYTQFIKDGMNKGEVQQEILDHFGGLDGIAEYLTNSTMNTCHNLSDAASLVFAHSIVDEYASDALKVVAYHSPQDFDKYLSNKKICISDLKGISYEKIIAQKALDYVNREI